MDSNSFIIPPSPPSNTPFDPDFAWRYALLPPCAALVAAAAPIPWLADRLTTADVLVAVSFGVLAVFLFCRNRRILFPVAIPVFLLLYGMSAAANPVDARSLAELLQRILQLFAGVAVLSWLVGWRPYWALSAVSGAVALSTAAAAVQWATGTPYGELQGLFPSRLAFCTFQGLALLWCFPQWFNLNVLPRTRALSIVAAALVLLPVSHGQILVAAALLLVFSSGITDRMAMWGALTALLLTVGLLAAPPGRADRWSELSTSLSPFENGQVKQAHVETVAACRMAGANPWFGVGPGNYQKHVGAHYDTLPNPNEQSIEADHQAAWSILAGSSGIPAAVLLPGAMLVAALSVFRRFRAPRNARERSFLGGASLALGILLLGWLTNPFVRGNGWMVALSFACMCTMHAGQVREIGRRGLALALLVTLLPVGGIVAKMALAQDDASDKPDVVELTWREGTSTESDTSIAEAPEVAALLGPDDATRVTPPMKRQAQGDMPLVLVLPEGAGTPPPDRAPSLDDGGAVFPAPDSLSADTEYFVWLFTRWDDGCGNSVAVQFDDEPPVVAGNDGTYERWHWVKVPGTLRPAPGSEVKIINREDGISVSHILFSESDDFVPSRRP